MNKTKDLHQTWLKFVSVPYTKRLHITWNIVHSHDVFTAFFMKSSTFHCLSSWNILSNISFCVLQEEDNRGSEPHKGQWWHENGNLRANSSFTVMLSTTLHDAMEESSSLQSFKPFNALRFQCTYCNGSWYATLSGLGWFAMPLGCICDVDTSLITQDTYT